MSRPDRELDDQRTPLDPETAARQYLDKQISLERYVQVLDAYVPSSEMLLRSLDDNKEYVARLAESLDRSEASSRANDKNGDASSSGDK